MKTPRLLTTAIAAAALLLGAAAGAVADTMIKTVTVTDAFKMMGQERPARTDTTQTWMTDGRAAILLPQNQKVILRLDEDMLYVINGAEKSYFEAPASAVKALVEQTMAEASESDSAAAQMQQQISVKVTPTEQTKKVKDWNATRYDIMIELPMMTSTSQMWVSEDVDIDWDMFRAVQMHTYALMPGSDKIFEDLAKIDGMTVEANSTMEMMGTEVVSTMELLEVVNDAEAPAAVYEIPSDFQKTANPMQGMGR